MRYMELATAIPREQLATIQTGMAEGSVHPKDAKVQLAKALVAQYHSPEAAEVAARQFTETFSARVFPADAPAVTPPADFLEPGGKVWIVRLVTFAGAASSGSEARRLIRQGGVEVDGVSVRDEDLRVVLDRERRIQVGKRRFFRVLPPQRDE